MILAEVMREFSCARESLRFTTFRRKKLEGEFVHAAMWPGNTFPDCLERKGVVRARRILNVLPFIVNK
jgi:hypothetical protein